MTVKTRLPRYSFKSNLSNYSNLYSDPQFFDVSLIKLKTTMNKFKKIFIEVLYKTLFLVPLGFFYLLSHNYSYYDKSN